ncbi:MAG TPA: TIGR02680 family protein [Thermoanaerobaculia bacterium]|nr:TIGR02680 family protein [Thermoanaerobaculia bacterium]
MDEGLVQGGTLEIFPGGAAAAAALPAPGRERFQPLRAGILNIWQYDEQELRFHQGRLILRGENGSGKSKALEVLLPFLFDADLSPQRLDPFGGTSRSMEWNLLQDGRFESRVGYVWLELGRCGDGAEVCWTLGCGLRATQRTRRVEAWYFLTRRRVGRDLFLLSAQRTPLLKDQLRQQIGEEGWVFDTGRDYREKLDIQIFGLGEDRFATLRHLLLQLRRPHLSERLDPATLAEILKESLPPLDTDLIGQLSESFERLDNEQKELARVEAAVAGVAAFLETYREYGRGIARARSAEVRQTDSRYHKTAAEVREAEEERERLDGGLADLGERESDLEAETAAVRGKLQGLEKSDLMRSAEALQAQREHAEVLAQRASQEREDANREAQRQEDRRRDFDSAEAEARRSTAEREAAAALALAAAREAGLEALAAAALAALSERAAAAEALVRAAVHRQEEGIAELRRLAQDRDRAERQEERSEEKLREADARLRQAVARSLAARAEVERQRQQLEEALAGWQAGLVEMDLDAAALEPLLDRIQAIAGGEEVDLAGAVAALAAPRRDALVRERAALEEEVARVAAERRAVDEERRRVESARELGPEPPRTRESDRTERPGAPLYLLCEFTERLGAEERAGLEAALEASGLLDAWVLPDGGVLSPGTLDTFLVPADLVTETSLANLLRPAPDHGVEREVIEAVLRSIEVGPAGAGFSSVGKDGAFRLGPLSGAWAKPVAEHVGAGAREAARARRLAEIAAQLEELNRRLAGLAAQGETLDARLARLDHEALAAPSASPLTRAVHQAAAATSEEIRQRTERDAAEQETAAARAARQAAERRLAARARELDLAGWLDDLEGARLSLLRFETGFRELVRAAASAVAATERSERARQLLDEAASRAAELRSRAQESAAAAQSAAAEYATLEATVGVEAREVLELHRAESRRLGDLEHREKRLGEEIQTAREQRARIRERLELRQVELAEREAERAGAVARLGRWVDAGLLPLVLGESAEPPPAWSLTRALDLAREIEKATANVDLGPEAANRRVNRLHEQFRLLAADLGADYQPSLDQDEDLVRARVGYNGREYDVPGLLATLRENLEVRRNLLAEHEREVLRRYLLGEVGDHLRHRLREARALVEEMNRLLEECRTASGLTLKLAWEPTPEAAPEIRDAVQLIRQDLALLADHDRRRLEAFFQARISEARQQWEAVPWREHLMAALDYRAWHRFRILRRTGDDSGWIELTRRGHGASSGGEKAVALHLPLFAAAAAHYRSALPTAPRVILLDEAFAGIDQRMRGRCMGLLVDFDLDFMMTSHEEWGCYEELPGVATYQLYRDPALDGVAAVRFVWSGHSLREDPAG